MNQPIAVRLLMAAARQASTKRIYAEYLRSLFQNWIG
jgi:hypothetical protein